MEATSTPEAQACTCFISSTPVFDRDRAIQGVEVISSCLGSCDKNDEDGEAYGAFIWLVTTGIGEIDRLADEHGKLYISLHETVMSVPEVGNLPWDKCVLEVCPEPMVPEEYLDACHAIRTSGYRLAVRLGFAPTGLEPLLEQADEIVLDLARMGLAELVQAFKQVRAYSVPVMIAGLDTWEDFTGAQALGADLFRGAFFGRPEVIRGQELQANALARMELMRALQDDNASFKDIAAVIAKDAFLSYRLLSYVNSPSLALGRDVTSIEHAVVLLGFEPFKQWALMALVSSLDASPKGEMLAYLSLQRASFLSNLGAISKKSPYPAKKMFVLGLFSMLDAMLGRPMKEIVSSIPMDKALKTALCGGQSAAKPWLDLLADVDRNRWPNVVGFLKGHDVEYKLATKAYLDASRWARLCFKAGKESAQG